MSIWLLLIQFVFRLTWGVAFAMALTPSKQVTSGFFRVHLWVLLGLNTFAALAAWTQQESLRELLPTAWLVGGWAVGLAVISYVGSVLWLYEARRPGVPLLYLVAIGGLVGAVLATAGLKFDSLIQPGFALADISSSGLLMGATLTAMLLGHWYLNTPTMQLLPLQRLIQLMTAAVLLRMLVCLAGTCVLLWQGNLDRETAFWVLVGFRWLAGLVVVLVLAVMTWWTLKVPNTQSATGILYAAVILTFLGELTSQLLSADTSLPL